MSVSLQGRLGTIVPNRIFVGGISPSTTEHDLEGLFCRFGNVKACKIIVDRNGVSKGYGFVTYETKGEADAVLRDFGNTAESLTLNDRKLNIAPAIKKMQPSSLVGEPSGMMSRRDLYQAYPVMLPPPMYISPYQYPGAITASGAVQQIYPGDYYPYTGPSFPSVEEYREATVGSPPEPVFQQGGKHYQKHGSQQASSLGSDYDSFSPQAKTSHLPSLGPYRYATASSGIASPVHPPSYHLHQLLPPKAGMTIMAYPSSIVVGTPIVHVKDSGSSETENIMTEMGYLHSPIHSPITAGALTPPPTPLASFPCDMSSGSSIETSRKN